MSGFLLTRDVIRYAAMPEIMPRVRSLLFGGFGYIPFFIAAVYHMVGLLPSKHPYLMQENIGRYGIRHVVAQAASNITFRLRNIDQIILFVAVLAGLVIFVIQFFAIASVFVLQPAMALPTSWAQFFTVITPGFREQDIAFMMLDMVFGVPHPSLSTGIIAPVGMGFFESCVGSPVVCQDTQGNALTNIPTGLIPAVTALNVSQLSPLAPGGYTVFPFPYHIGLHRLFAIYSTALLVIAVMVTSYFVATILGETAQSGTPFGRRFNKTWAPLRIVIAFGLLVPLTVGLNSSQYLVLYSAKYGSAFATNGWRYFNTTLTTSYIGAAQRLISRPSVPAMNELTHFMFVARTCKYAYDYYHLTRINAERALILPVPPPALLALAPADEVHAYALYPETQVANSALIALGSAYGTIKDGDLTANSRIMKIRFGVKDPLKYEDSHSNISPVCGEITIPYTDGRTSGTQEQYSRTIQEGYFILVKDLWFDTMWINVAGGPSYPSFQANTNHRYEKIVNERVNGLPDDLNHQTDLDSLYVSNINLKVKNQIELVVTQTIIDAAATPLWGGLSNGAPTADALYSRGWASAGIWYNRIAQLNGQVSAAVFATPTVSSYPAMMEQVSDVKAKYDAEIFVADRFKPESGAIGDIGLLLDRAVGTEYAGALYAAYSQWITASGVESQLSSNNNPIIGYIKFFFGLSGLYNMRDNQAANTHPLAQLSGVGKALVEGSIRSLSYAGISTIVGGFGVLPNVMSIAANFLITFAMLGLTVGFILFYVVPFLPFIYFFFAVGGWIKGIFEAMVGAPLWALAHIRIDGNGLPGNAALNGYFLIFEVFLRPILIVFGMLASISIYTALVSVLNDIFSLIAENAAGYDLNSEISASRDTLKFMRSEVDEFFFTVIYVIIVYMLGMSSFKLVDTMPNNILRWMGQSVATFGDQREDPAANLVSRASIGSQQALGQVGRGLQGASQAGISAGK